MVSFTRDEEEEYSRFFRDHGFVVLRDVLSGIYISYNIYNICCGDFLYNIFHKSIACVALRCVCCVSCAASPAQTPQFPGMTPSPYQPLLLYHTHTTRIPPPSSLSFFISSSYSPSYPLPSPLPSPSPSPPSPHLPLPSPSLPLFLSLLILICRKCYLMFPGGDLDSQDPPCQEW